MAKNKKKKRSVKPLIVVLGFYGRNNLGDDMYSEIFSRLLSNYKSHDYLIVNPDDIRKLPKNTKMVICGGGELFNDYYIPKIKQLVAGLDVPVYGFSIGFPYPQLIDEKHLSVFDAIITRNRNDVDAVSEVIGYPFVKYSPDLATLWEFFESSNELGFWDSCKNCGQSNLNRMDIIEKYGLNNIVSSKKKIGVFLARSIYSELENGSAYKRVLTKLASLLTSFAMEQKCSKLC